MRQVIRTNVFETNSSSVHSLVMPIDNSNFNKRSDFEYIIKGDGFGWGPDTFKEPRDILNYLWSGVYNNPGYAKKLKDLFPDCTFIEPVDDGWGWVYVDHQSEDLPLAIMSKSDSEIIDIVNNGILLIDNDNQDEDDMLINNYDIGGSYYEID